MHIGVIFPHQLFEHSQLITTCKTIYLVEEVLFFKQYPFHKQKIVFHRASMKYYGHYLQSKGVEVVYIDSFQEQADVRKLIPFFKTLGITHFEYMDPTDNWLERRISESCKAHGLTSRKHPSLLFINSPEELSAYFSKRSRMFQTDFYKQQRLSRTILVNHNGQPTGGKWTFDEENRLKYPKGKIPPKIAGISLNPFYEEAMAYTETHFSTNYGALNRRFFYPVTFEESKHWFMDFLENRFAEFGAYEDAIVSDQSVLHHSVLTPMLNVGLLTPQFILEKTLQYAAEHEIHMNSVEGFVRQIMGWREYIRAVYELKGNEERTKNFWGFTRKIPTSFWTGTTGIEPVDSTIKKVLETGYCHHIERLMVLGNFMLLCEFDPDEVYRWFMELFIDSYDWVMVPNVYGMSQFADGGLMSTKPYISGSNYLMKMSDFKKGDWQQTWDGLFWRFMHVNRDFFLQNPRLGMLISSFDKMEATKRNGHLEAATRFLDALDSAAREPQ